MPPTLQDLQRQIDALQAQILLMQQSVGITRDTETALIERLNLTGIISSTGIGSAGSTTVISAFPFNLPANPSGIVNTVINGTKYGLLYK